MDRISKLPLGVIQTILCLLPIHEAARTSILSREWRYRWITIPKLEFNEFTFQELDYEAEPSFLELTFAQPSHRELMSTRCKFFYAIYQVLFMHQGPIHEFTLSMEANHSCVEIDHIIRYFSKENTIKILKLELNGVYELPSSLFSLHKLTGLYLNGCVLDHQPSSNVFHSLTTLYLRGIQTCKKGLPRLLSSCPSLKRLTILSDDGTIYDTGDYTIADLIKCVPLLEYLSLTFFIFLRFLPLPKELPTTLVHLKYLCMEWVSFCHKYSVPFLVLLIRSSPNLEKLKLEINAYKKIDESVMGPFIPEECSDIMLEHLNELEILFFCNGENELAFVKLILAKSPVLKKVRILLWNKFTKKEKLKISKILLSLPCASPVVQITVRWYPISLTSSWFR